MGKPVSLPAAPDVADLRRTYRAGGLLERDADADPYTQFGTWLGEALAAGLVEPNAMVLSTATPEGVPSSRHVLLKGVDPDHGFAFFTNLRSHKSQEVTTNPYASLCFPWFALERQVVVAGSVSAVDRAEARAYFQGRPWESRIGAWASAQSSVVESREELEQAFDACAQRWPEGTEVPLPEHWGGWWVQPVSVEFWQGRPGRMHDRLRYVREGAGQAWRRERLAP